MLFSSLQFFVFFVVVYSLFRLLRNRGRVYFLLLLLGPTNTSPFIYFQF